MQNYQKIVTVFGGTGFVGNELVKKLAKAGYMVNVIARYPDKARSLKLAGPVGKVTLTQGSITDKSSVETAAKHSWAIINLVGLLYESGNQTFKDLHVKSAKMLAKAASDHGVERLIHMSALGVDKNKKSRYAKTKFEGEKSIQKIFSDATIMRPSIIFGRDDNFFNKFAHMAVYSPFLPLIGGGYTRFQPVYVKDVAEAFCNALNECWTKGKTYELGGPKIYSFKELLEFVLYETNRYAAFLPLPFFVAKTIGFFTQILPHPPLTIDQVRLLETDNIVIDRKNNIESLGVKPKFMETIVSGYLARYAKNSRQRRF